MRAGFLLDLRQPFLARGGHGPGNAVNPDAQRVQQQLLAERVKIVSRDEPPSDAKAPWSAKQVGNAVEKRSKSPSRNRQQPVAEAAPPPVVVPETKADEVADTLDTCAWPKSSSMMPRVSRKLCPNSSRSSRSCGWHQGGECQLLGVHISARRRTRRRLTRKPAELEEAANSGVFRYPGKRAEQPCHFAGLFYARCSRELSGNVEGQEVSRRG